MLTILLGDSWGGGRLVLLGQKRREKEKRFKVWPSGDGMLINTLHCDNAWYLLISEWKSWYYNGEDNSYFVRFVLFDKRAALFVCSVAVCGEGCPFTWSWARHTQITSCLRDRVSSYKLPLVSVSFRPCTPCIQIIWSCLHALSGPGFIEFYKPLDCVYSDGRTDNPLHPLTFSVA